MNATQKLQLENVNYAKLCPKLLNLAARIAGGQVDYVQVVGGTIKTTYIATDGKILLHAVDEHLSNRDTFAAYIPAETIRKAKPKKEASFRAGHLVLDLIPAPLPEVERMFDLRSFGEQFSVEPTSGVLLGMEFLHPAISALKAYAGPKSVLILDRVQDERGWRGLRIRVQGTETWVAVSERIA